MQPDLLADASQNQQEDETTRRLRLMDELLPDVSGPFYQVVHTVSVYIAVSVIRCGHHSLLPTEEVRDDGEFAKVAKRISRYHHR